MLFLINPGERSPHHQGKHMAARKKAPTRKQLAARKKFVAMVRARAKAAKSTRAQATGGTSMATRKRKRATTRTRTRRRAVSAVRSNPRHHKRRRKHHFRRNPPREGGRSILANVKGLAKDTAYGVVGATAGPILSNLIPIGATSVWANYAKQGAIALALRVFGAKVVGADAARMIAQGAAIGPATAALNQAVPQLSTMFSSYSPGLGANVTAIPGINGPLRALPRGRNGLFDSYSRSDPMSSYTGGPSSMSSAM